MKTHTLLLTLVITLLFGTQFTTAATILLTKAGLDAKPATVSIYVMKFHNIPENPSAEPYLTIVVEFENFDQNDLGILQNWRQEIYTLCKQKGGIRNQKDHYEKLMPIIEQYCEKIKSLHPTQIKLSFPRIKEEAALREVK